VEPLTKPTLAVEVSLDRTTTTGALKRLQARTFYRASGPPDDRRARACRLTAAGTALLVKMESAARAAHRDTLASLSKSEQKRFITLMQQIVAANSFET